MSVGERIVQKRKELGLSQEALGERLGVSRQAIYKWESDQALPEVEKLVTLSRVFSVSVGWLLGEEEDQEKPELTAEQLAMVEEIVGRYLEAQPKPEPPQKPDEDDHPGARLLILALKLVGVCLAISLVALGVFQWMEIEERFAQIQTSFSAVRSSINEQVGAISGQVEEILKSQNDLTASYGVEITGADLAANTVTFTARAVPKTYTQGMTAVFTADYGTGTVEIPVEPGEGYTFSGEVTCPLTDEIALSVAFLTGDKRETQALESYEYLYTNSFPDVYLESTPLCVDVREGVLVEDTSGAAVEASVPVDDSWVAEPTEIRVGLFRDQELVYWYEPRKVSVNNGATAETRHFRPGGEYQLEPGHVYCAAAVVADQYGRERITVGDGLAYSEERGWAPDDTIMMGSHDPADWTY